MKRARLGGLILTALLLSGVIGAAQSWAAGAPVNTKLPTMTVTSPQQGTVERSGNGEWTNSPTSYTYQWQRCNASGAECVSIAGATEWKYEVGEGDLGHTIRTQVTAHNASGERAASSLPSNLIPAAKHPELVPAPTELRPLSFSSNQVAWDFTAPNMTFLCTGTMSGKFVGPYTAKDIVVKFTNCGQGAAFETHPLEGTIGWQNETSKKVALRLRPESGTIWTKLFYESGYTLEGTLFGELGPYGKSTTSFELGYGAEGDKQKLLGFEYPFENKQLNSNVCLQSFCPTAVSGSTGFSTSSKVEIH